MPFPLEEVSLKDLIRHPKLVLLYAAFVGIGLVVNKIMPDDCHREVAKWQSLAYTNARGWDSVQRTKDILYEDLLIQKRENRVNDSVLLEIGAKANKLLKYKKP